MPLKIVSYNIQGHAAQRRADHLPKIAQMIVSLAPDIIGLQVRTDYGERVRVRVRPVDPADEIIRVAGEKTARLESS